MGKINNNRKKNKKKRKIIIKTIMRGTIKLNRRIE